jgi:hypothetical protein
MIRKTPGSQAQGLEEEFQAGAPCFCAVFHGPDFYGDQPGIIDGELQIFPALVRLACGGVARSVPGAVRRCPIPSMRPRFLMSIGIISPGGSFSERIDCGPLIAGGEGAYSNRLGFELGLWFQPSEAMRSDSAMRAFQDRDRRRGSARRCPRRSG